MDIRLGNSAAAAAGYGDGGGGCCGRDGGGCAFCALPGSTPGIHPDANVRECVHRTVATLRRVCVCVGERMPPMMRGREVTELQNKINKYINKTNKQKVDAKSNSSVNFQRAAAEATVTRQQPPSFIASHPKTAPPLSFPPISRPRFDSTLPSARRQL